MLVLSRKSGQSITIQPEAGADLSQSAGQFFHNQPIKVYVKEIDRGVARLAISAHRALNIVRDELLSKPKYVTRDVLNNGHYGNARQSLAANLYTHRQSREWTLYDLAQVTKIPIHVLTAMEHGVNRVNLEDLEVIAEVFGIEVAGLFKE
jgi:sRNA-binding carbon storage regulator CsrA